MALTVAVITEALLPGGAKILRGTFTLDSNYVTGGETMDLSDYLKSSVVPTVICGNDGGYVLEHDQGTAAAGKVIAYYNDVNASTNAALVAVAQNADLSAINSTFVAVGQAY
jgi:hypothetical protein